MLLFRMVGKKAFKEMLQNSDSLNYPGKHTRPKLQSPTQTSILWIIFLCSFINMSPVINTASFDLLCIMCIFMGIIICTMIRL